MSILTIAINLIFLIDEILSYRAGSKAKSGLSSPIAEFDIKKWVTGFTFMLFILVNGVIVYFKDFLTIFDLIFMLVLDTTILMKLYKSIAKVKIYNEGIFVKGIFIHWDMVDDISEYANGNYLVSSQYLSGSSIKTGIINDREGFKKISHEKYIKSRTSNEEESDEMIDKPFFGIIADIIIRLRRKKD